MGIRLPQLLALDHGQERILKEYIGGSTIAQLVSEKKMKPEYIEAVQQMCSLLYPAGLNIDYECNLYDPKWDFEYWGKQYW